MITKKQISILLILIGFISYLYGFIWYSKTNILIMLLGGYLIFIPVFFIGVSMRSTKKTLSTIIITLSCMFIAIITITLVGSISIFIK
jgi:hypothetical protein